jgi:hypothetical protein
MEARMADDIPARSAALGFWTRHQDAMDSYESFDDENPAPAPLQDIFKDKRFSSLLERIYEVGSDEGEALVHAVADALAQLLTKHPRLTISRKRRQGNWKEIFHVRRKRSQSNEYVEIGFRIYSHPESGLTLYSYLWTKGGRSAELFNAKVIREVCKESVVKGGDDKAMRWYTGVVLLAKERLEEYVVGYELDVAALANSVNSHVVARCTGEVVSQILEKRMASC